MSKIIYRFISLIMVLMISTFMVSCSSTSQAEKGLNKLEVNKLDPVTLTFYLPGRSTPVRSDIQLVHKEIENKAGQLKIKLNFKWYNYDYNEYNEKIKTIIASREPVDAFCVGKPDQYSFDFTAMARNNELMDLTDLFPKFAFNLYNMYTADDLACAKVDGKLVAIPPISPNAKSNRAVIRMDLVKKYNIQDIKTFDDYAGFLQTIKANEKGIIPAFINGINLVDLFARPFGYVVLDEGQRLVYKQDDPNMKLYAWEQTPEFKKGVSYLTTWLEKGYLADPAQSISIDKIASSLGYDIVDVGESSTTWSMGDNGSTEAKVFNLYPEKKIIRESPISNIYFGGAIAFNAQSKNVERALMFLDWINQSRDNYELFMYGIKDKHYVIKNGFVKLPDGMDYEKSPYMYWNSSTTFTNFNLESQFDSGEGKQWLDFIKNETKYAYHEGFHPDYTSVQHEADNRAEYFDRHIEMPLMYNFTYKPEETDWIIDSLRNNGTDNVVEAVQKQLDEWKANNKK